MKTKFLILIALLVSLFNFNANAQVGFDLFGAPRVAVVAAPQNLVPGASFVTNTIDMGFFDGFASLLITSATNSGATGGVLAASLYGSNDKTNFTALTYALATSQTISSTNRYFGGTNLTASTVYLVPGTWTYPSAATAGFATPYLNAALYTNTAAITLTTGGVYNIGLAAKDLPRYLHVVFNPSATVTNFTVSATLIGATHSAQLGN